MSRQQLFRFEIGIPCDGFMCIAPTRWAVGVPGATAATYHKLCEEDARHIARTLPAELLAEALAAAPTDMLVEVLAPRLDAAVGQVILEAAARAFQPEPEAAATDNPVQTVTEAPAADAKTRRCACGKTFDLTKGFGRKNYERHTAVCPKAQEARAVA